MGNCSAKWSGEGNTEKKAIEDLLKTMQRVCYNTNFYNKGTVPYVKFRYGGIRYNLPIIIEKEGNNYYAYIY